MTAFDPHVELGHQLPAQVAPASVSNETALSRAIIRAAGEMVRRGLVVGTSGNVSARIHDGFLITPTRSSYGRMTTPELVYIGRNSKLPGVDARASIETPLHRAAYALRDDIGAVVHTHSPYAIAWGLLGEPLIGTEDLEYYGLTGVGTAPRAPARSGALVDICRSFLTQSNAVLLAGHGVLAVGADPTAALMAALVVERQAEISCLVRMIEAPL